MDLKLVNGILLIAFAYFVILIMCTDPADIQVYFSTPEMIMANHSIIVSSIIEYDPVTVSSQQISASKR